MAYAGFDRADCPDLAIMARLKAQTNFVWCGYYLRAPSQSAVTWRGKRAALAAQGWGLAPIFVGQQTTGPGSHVVTAARGTIDGAQAVADMVAEGFPQGSWVYLDIENGQPFPVAERGYAQAWAAAVDFGGYRAGVYCSFTFAAQVAAILPKARLWVFHVQSVSPHPVAGKAFPAPDPSKSGYPSAVIWQHQDEARLDDFGGLACDLDSSIYADPGAPDSAATPVAKPVAPAVTPTHTTVMAPVGSPVWIQQALNWAGASPALEVDGVIGPATYTAILAFQDKHGLAADGYVGPRTIAALQAAIQERA